MAGPLQFSAVPTEGMNLAVKPTARFTTALTLTLALTLAMAAAWSDDAPGTGLIPAEKLRRQAETATPAAVEFLAQSIKYQSVEDFGYQLKPETKALMQYVFAQARKLGFKTRLAAGGLVGVLEYGEGQQTVGVLVHLDVVPASVGPHGHHWASLASHLKTTPQQQDTGEHWTYPPFSGKVADGYVWGRGAQDDKGALAATLWGAKLLIDDGMHFKRKLRIILGTKEEKSFEALTRYFQEEKQPDYGLVPDGVYFISGEKGIADLQVTFQGPAAQDRKRDTVVYWSGGTAINTVPDFSYMVIASKDIAASLAELQAAVQQTTTALKSGKSDRFFGVTAPYDADLAITTYDDFVKNFALKDVPKGDLVLYSRGKAVHGSIPWAGRNSIIEVALAASLLNDVSQSAATQAIDFVATRVGLNCYGGGLIDASGEGIPFTPPTGLPKPPLGLPPIQYYGTSSNLGLVQLDPATHSVTLSIDFRTGLGTSNRQILQHTQFAAARSGGKAAYSPGVGSHYDPIYSPGESPIMKLAVQSYVDLHPDHPPGIPGLYFSPATTYLKLVKNFVNFGPVDMYPDPTVNRFHQPDERIAIKSLTENIALFAHALQLLIQANPSPVAATQLTDRSKLN